MLPNLRGVVLADAGMRITAAVSMVTVGTFLGLGLTPPTPDWAVMVTENRAGIVVAPWAVLVPAGLILVLVVAVNLWADRHAPADAQAGRPVTREVTLPAVSDDAVLVEGLTVTTADGTTLLDDVALRVGRGRSVAVVGPSGSGKTTLALALLGEAPPGATAGRRRVGGRRSVSGRAAGGGSGTCRRTPPPG